MSSTKHHRARHHADDTPQDGFEILDTAHAEAITALDRMSDLVSQLQAHGVSPVLRAEAAEISRFFSTYALEHHLDEEKHVFPRLLEEGDDQTVRAVQSLLQDHRWLDEDWREVGAQIDAIAGGQGWVDMDTLAEGVRIFCGLMRAHIAFEESYLYPLARASLTERLRAEMGREMAARHRSAHRSSRDVMAAGEGFDAPADKRMRH